eukprot:c2709_g1_i3.p1 GENE.c2709_g1_i3~~c2709_g1_i3.p1  ORF type:complete len:257 (-),score=23.51 c2709_g1_i3:208-978(-)
MQLRKTPTESPHSLRNSQPKKQRSHTRLLQVPISPPVENRVSCSWMIYVYQWFDMLSPNFVPNRCVTRPGCGWSARDFALNGTDLSITNENLEKIIQLTTSPYPSHPALGRYDSNRSRSHVCSIYISGFRSSSNGKQKHIECVLSMVDSLGALPFPTIDDDSVAVEEFTQSLVSMNFKRFRGNSLMELLTMGFKRIKVRPIPGPKRTKTILMNHIGIAMDVDFLLYNNGFRPAQYECWNQSASAELQGLSRKGEFV